MLYERVETGSTNDDARELALKGAPHGTAVLARAQKAGRGRAGREWSSPTGGFYLSVVLRPSSSPASWSILPLALGAATARVLGSLGFSVGVKWPNDLLIDGKKVAGILLESRLGDAPFVVAGIGINLRDIPAAGGTSLDAHGAAPAARDLAKLLIDAFVNVCARLDAGLGEPLRAEVREACVSLGRSVEWEGGKGTAVDVDLDGALVVEIEKARERIVAGDVRLTWR